MVYSIFDFRAEELPEKVSVLSLKNTILIPGTKISVRLVDPCHISTVTDALSQCRMVAVIQPKKQGSLFNVGCLGRITSFAETEDSHLLVTVKGICRFKVLQEFRRDGNVCHAAINYDTFRPDLNEIKKGCDIDRKALIDVLSGYVKCKNINFDVRTLEAVETGRLPDTIVMMLPFEAREKQVFLEARTPEEAYKTLMMLIKTETIACI